MRWLKNPSSNKPDPMLTMSVIVVLAASIKFITEGVTVQVAAHNINFGHADSLTYGALLGSVLGVHGYIKTKTPPKPVEETKNE